MRICSRRSPGEPDRRAYYDRVPVLVRCADDPQPLIADARWDGEVVEHPRGTGGFGYDPHFLLPTLGIAPRPNCRSTARTRSAIGARRCARCGSACGRPVLSASPVQRVRLAGRLESLPPLSLYVHLPWCLRKCPYCDFNSHQWQGEGEPAADVEDGYVDALQADLEAALPRVWGRTVHTVFIGGERRACRGPGDRPPARHGAGPASSGARRRDHDGGQPRHLRGAAFSVTMRRRASIAWSIGVQSFDDGLLETIGRVHDAGQAHAAADLAARCFETFNLDLMYALPGQTMAQWSTDLAAALAHHPPHLSCYHLTLEPNTLFARFPPALPDEDLSASMQEFIDGTLAPPGSSTTRCRHSPGPDIGPRTT
jgi:hypothetical protein